MKRFIQCPDWAFKMFASLCFNQVKEQLPENLIYHVANPPSFICNGQLFAFTPTQSLIIIDESPNGYGMPFN